MFKLDLSPTYWATIKFNVQSADGEKRETHAFEGQFPRMTESELQAFGRKVSAENLTDAQAAALLLRDWRVVSDAQGNPLPFNTANLQLVLNQAGVAYAVIKTFRNTQPEAASGN